MGKQDLISPLHHLESSSYDYYEDEEEEEANSEISDQ